jgi:hypothetical protein
MSNLSFEELSLERPTFTLEDGTEIEFRVQTDFDAVDAAKAAGLQKKFDNLRKRLQARQDDVKAAEKMHDAYGEFVHMILPDLPVDVLNGLKTGQRLRLIQWWNQAQKATNPGEE